METRYSADSEKPSIAWTAWVHLRQVQHQGSLRLKVTSNRFVLHRLPLQLFGQTRE